MKNQTRIYTSPKCGFALLGSKDIISTSTLGEGLYGLPNLDVDGLEEE